MANPNPFLFGAPAAGGGMEPPNPFLSGADPSAAANPFLGGGVSAPPQPPQYGAFASPQPMVDASNPFASFGAAAPTIPPQPSSLFGNTSGYNQQPPQPQPQHQQYHGQYGQYTQVTADNSSQPVLSASIQSPPVPSDPKANPFAPLADTQTPDKVTMTPPLAGLEPKPKPAPEIMKEPVNHLSSTAMEATN